jgi:2-haloacid dehalogenase
MDLRSFDALTFDCYGTLIDWETGITHALGFLAARAGRDPTELVELFGEIEREAEAGPYRSYRDVLADVARAIAARLGLSLEPGEETLLAESVGDWPAHPDTQGAMRALKERSRLGILSNVDHDLFEGTRPKLGVELDVVVTAEDVRGYKPGLAHFERGLEALGLPAGRVLQWPRAGSTTSSRRTGWGSRWSTWTDRAARARPPAGPGAGRPTSPCIPSPSWWT